MVTLSLLLAALPVFGDLDRSAHAEVTDSTLPVDPVRAAVESAVEKAQRSGKPTPVWQLTGERREVVARPDGLLEQNLTTAPARTWRSGRWVDVDTTLQRAEDGSLSPAASTVGLTFSGGGSAPFVRMFRAGREFSLTLPGTLPAPQVDSDTATYHDFPFAGVDLQVRALENGFTHSFLVQNAEAAGDPRLASIEMQIGGGLTAESDGEGGLRVKDPGSGGVLFEAPQPRMWDSTLIEGTAGQGERLAQQSDEVREAFEEAPGMASKVAPVEATVSGQTLTLVPDSALLSEPSVTFPLVIDPAWRTPLSSSAVMVNTDYGSKTSWADEGMGKCADSDPYMSDCGGDGTVVKRLFYTFKPAAGWKDQAVIAAEFEVNEVHAYNCNPTEMQVWRTKQAFGSTTWGQQAGDNFGSFWLEKLAAKSVAYGNEYVGCNDHTVQFRSTELKNYIQSLDNTDTPTLTFGLKAADEGSVTGWKRFTNKAALRLVINLRPNQPQLAHMEMDNGTSIDGKCQPASDPLIVTGAPKKLQAGLTDPNVKEKLQGEAVLSWDDGSGWKEQVTGLTSDIKGESDDFQYPTLYTFPITTSSSTIFLPENKLISWKVRAWDFKKDPDTGQDTDEWQSASIWSNVQNPDSPDVPKHACHFIIDKAKPPAPEITSADGRYPKSPPNTGWYGGPNIAGKFNFRATSTLPQDKPVSYRIQLNEWSTPEEIPADGDGNLLNHEVIPTSGGEKWLKVEAKDQANRVSASAFYGFHVNYPSPYEAYWRLDETEGTQAINEMDTSQYHLQLKGDDHKWEVQGKVGTALELNVKDTDPATRGYAETEKRVVDPTQSFTVAAWARLDSNAGWATVVSQEGEVDSSFYLAYYKSLDRWALSFRGGGGAIAKSLQPPQIGKWTHLVGVYDATTKQYKLYVNGALEGTSGTVPTWDGNDGPLTVGRAKTAGNPVDFFPGAIDDVRVLKRAVTATEVQRMFYGTVAARWKLDTHSSGQTLDDTGIALTLNDQAATATGTRCGALVVDSGCLVLGDPAENHAIGKDYAVTGGPIIRTDESFTVAGHVMLSATTGKMALFSQAGTTTSAFTVWFNEEALNGAGAWEIDVPDRDAADAVHKTVVHDQCRICNGESAPDHVAVVYDAPRKTLSLYVNGLLSQVVQSERDDIVTFNAGGPFRIGATLQGGQVAEFLRGVVDDVWVYQGVLSTAQVEILALGQSGLTREKAP